MSNFLREFENLKKRYPLLAIRGNDNDNSDYGNYLFDCKNTYYSFDSLECQDSFYLFDCGKMDGCMDANFSGDCENSYEINDSANLYNCVYVFYSARCYDCYYSINLVDCHDCFGSVNLSHKSFCIFNKQYSEEEYFERIKELKKEDAEKILQKVFEIEKKFPKLYAHSEQNENSDYCDYLFRSQNCYYCFDSTDLEDSGYLFNVYDSKNSWDGTYNVRCQNCYETNDSADSYNLVFAEHSDRCYDSSFIYNCKDSHDLFGCVNLSNRSFCILNKQLSEEEYHKKINHIRKELSWPEPVEIN